MVDCVNKRTPLSKLLKLGPQFLQALSVLPKKKKRKIIQFMRLNLLTKTKTVMDHQSTATTSKILRMIKDFRCTMRVQVFRCLSKEIVKLGKI